MKFWNSKKKKKTEREPISERRNETKKVLLSSTDFKDQVTQNKTFPALAWINRIPPATSFGTRQITDNFWTEERLFQESLTPMQDVYRISASNDGPLSLTVEKYTGVQRSIKKGKIVYDFGHEPNTLYNFIFEDELGGILNNRNENYWTIFVFEEDVADACHAIKEQVRDHLNRKINLLIEKMKLLENL
jgi:hypothetical protein